MNHRTEKTVITVETLSRTTVHLRRMPKIAWCGRCGGETVMLAPDEAAVHLQITEREIFRLAEAGELHFFETASGSLLICGDSLPAENKEH